MAPSHGAGQELGRGIVDAILYSPLNGGVELVDSELSRRQLLQRAIALSIWSNFGFMPSQTRAAGPAFTPAEPTDAWLKRHLANCLVDYPIPGISCGLMLDGQIAAEAALGVRKWGDPTPLLATDSQQIGSITKVITGALTAKLIEKGLLSWDTTLADVFPELVPMMQSAYRGVTVKLLMAHLSGMPYSPQNEQDNGFSHLPLRLGRYEYVRVAIQDPPLAAPGTKFIYGGGPIIVAAMLEKLTNRLWEELTQELIFEPLGMMRSHFGVEPGLHLQGASVVWEHTYPETGNAQPQPIQPAGQFAHGFKHVHGPAGCVNSTPGDMLRFMSAYFPDESGATPFFSADSYRTLTTFVNELKAPGFGVDERTPKLQHAARLAFEGCNMRNLAVIDLCPQTRNGYIWMINAYGNPVKTFGGTMGRVLSRPLVSGVASDPVMVPLTIEDQTTGLTAEWWQYQKPVEDYIRRQHTFVLRPDDLQNRFSVSSPWSDGKVVFDSGSWNSGGRLEYTPPESIIGSWHHFAFVADRASGRMAIYRNGVCEASKNSNQFLRPGQYNLYIGGDSTPFPGRLCEFRLWNRARTAGQIQTSFRQVLTNGDGLLLRVQGPSGACLPVVAN